MFFILTLTLKVIHGNGCSVGMLMKNELVSVYITTHNRKVLLVRAINSVLNQTYSNIEIIVSDDGSSDGTLKLMTSLERKHRNIKYIRSDVSEGACVARNKAILAASGRFITGLDDDDEFTSDRIEIFIKHWREEYAFLCSNFYHSNLSKLKRNYFCIFDKIFDFGNLKIENVASNQVFTKTSRLIEINGFTPGLKKFQDWDCWLRLSYKYGSFLRLSKCLYIMHHDHENANNRVSKSMTEQKAFEVYLYMHSKLLSERDKEYLQKFKVDNKRPNLIDLFKFKYANQKFFLIKELIKCFTTSK